MSDQETAPIDLPEHLRAWGIVLDNAILTLSSARRDMRQLGERLAPPGQPTEPEPDYA